MKRRIRNLNVQIEERILREATFIIEKNSTVRETAKAIGVSKSTIHKDLTKMLLNLDSEKYLLVQEILQTNKEERTIRGGNATKQKYLKMKGDLK